MKRRHILVFPACTVLPAAAKAVRSDPKAFEAMVLDSVRRLNDWKKVIQNKDGLWQKRRLEVSKPKYDVVRSESALRPLVGTLQMYVHSIGHVPNSDRSAAEQELAVAEGGPLGIDGKDWVTIEYQLQFEPRDAGWVFFAGKCLNSMTVKINQATGSADKWYELTPEELKATSVHAEVLRAFDPPPAKRGGPAPSRRATQALTT